MSSTESSAQAALQKAKELQRLAIDSPTVEHRRQFQKHLISLCSYPNHQCKAFFGSLVARHFKEFDDLQDSAINAILDLCEDEDGKTRLIGIGGLKNTARADPRWVKGNAGVLVQLLDSPEGEIKQVHNALHTLLSVSPIETIEVFAEECRTSVKDSSESRRLILEFLSKHSSDVMLELFSSGSNIKAEDMFYKEFERLIRPSEPFEALTILRLLLPLSIVSGKNARKGDAKDFSRAMIEGVSPNAPVGAREEIVDLYGEYLARGPPLDPREIMRFYGTHGRTFVKMALEGRGHHAKKQLERMRTVVPDAVALWDKREEGPNEAKIIPDFCHALISRILETVLRKEYQIDMAAARTIEVLLYAVHQCHFFKDRRKELKRVDQDDLDDLRKIARNAAEKSKSKTDEIVFSNIRYMADDLSSPKDRLEKVKPSWLQETRPLPPLHPVSQPRPRKPPPSLGSRDGRPGHPIPPISPPPQAIVQPGAAVPPSLSFNGKKALSENESALAPSLSGADEKKDAKAKENIPLASRLSESGQSARESGQELPGSSDLNLKGEAPRSLASRLSKAPDAKKSNFSATTEPAASNRGARDQLSQAGVELLGPPSSVSQAGKELLGPPSSTNAGVELLGPPSTTATVPSGSQSGTQPVRELLTRGKTNEAGSDQSAGLAKSSLLDRLSPAPLATNGKRARNAGEHGESAPRPSLLSRMASKDDSPLLKKSRSGQSSAPSTESGRSLLSRMTREGAPPVTPPITISSSNAPAQAPGTGLTIRNAAIERAESGSSISIFGRAASGSIQTPTPKPETTDFFSIKHRASSSTPSTPVTDEKPQGISIRSASGTLKRPIDQDEGVVRKGRGFQRDADGDDIVMDFAPAEIVTPTNGSGAWKGPASAGKAKRMDGRRRF